MVLKLKEYHLLTADVVLELKHTDLFYLNMPVDFLCEQSEEKHTLKNNFKQTVYFNLFT